MTYGILTLTQRNWVQINLANQLIARVDASAMCDFPCRSPSYKGEIRQVLVGMSSGQVGSLMDRPWTSSHGTPPQMPEVASRTKSAQQACGEIDSNASLPCPCPKLHGGLDLLFCLIHEREFPVGHYLEEVLCLSVVVNFKAAVPQNVMRTKI